MWIKLPCMCCSLAVLGHDSCCPHDGSCCPHGVYNPAHTCGSTTSPSQEYGIGYTDTGRCATAPVKKLNVEIEYKSVSPEGINYLGPIPGRLRASSRSSGSSSARVCSRVASTCAQSRRKSGQSGSVTTIVTCTHTLFIPWLLLVMSWVSGGDLGRSGLSYGGVTGQRFYRFTDFRGKPAGRRRGRRATTNQVTAGNLQ